MPHPPDHISVVVVLMLENASFDRMLGFLKSPGYPIEGLTGQETVPLDPTRSDSERVQVTGNAGYRGDFEVTPSGHDRPIFVDPGHSATDVHEQLFLGSPAGTPSPTNQGFVRNYARQNDKYPDHGRNIMRCFAPDKLPVLTTLAREFAICDHWFSSVPGPTWPNRLYAHAATSAGHLSNDDGGGDYNIDTIYDRLSAARQSWRIYFHDIPQAITLLHLQSKSFRENFLLFSDFLADARSGTLPAYSFIEPRYIDFLNIKANDQHPPHDVALGEYLIADVYEALRTSPQWEETLLVVLYDEHGGLYDHVPPPATVNSDGRSGKEGDLEFNFDLLGVRVPAILVSPYIPKGTIDNTVYDHTSVPATLEKMYGLAPLTKRDEAANTFEKALSLPSPRNDAPVRLPRPQDPVSEAAYKSSQTELGTLTGEVVKEALRANLFSHVGVSELQVALVKLTKNIIIPGENAVAELLRLSGWADIEHDAAQIVAQFTTRFFPHLFDRRKV